MSPLLSLHSLQELKLNRNLQSLFFVVRLLITSTIAWYLYDNSLYSKIFIESSVYISLAIYIALSTIHYILILFRPANRAIFFLGSGLDVIFSISLLFLLPDQANIGVVIAITFILACLNDFKLFQLTLLNIIYMAAALLAGWYFNTLYDAVLSPAHLISATIFLLGYLYYFKNNLLTSHFDLKDSLNTAILQKKHLVDALFYLLPFHQRNQSPLTLLVIRAEEQQNKSKIYLKELISLYKSRLRKCDFLVQINSQHLAVLLSDTDSEQASKLVKMLKELVGKSDLKNSMINYAIVKLPLANPVALDDILHQSLQGLHEANLQKIERVIFISAKQLD